MGRLAPVTGPAFWVVSRCVASVDAFQRVRMGLAAPPGCPGRHEGVDVMKPSDGEVAAVVGFGGQYQLAARVVLAKLPRLDWIRVADPEAGVADDFQFKSGPRRHALQVKWSQPPGSFTWGDLTTGEGDKPGLFTRLADAWLRLRALSTDPLTVYLCTNNHASSHPAAPTTPIGRAGADGTRSLATFLAQSFEPIRLEIAHGTTQWNDLAQLPEVVRWAPAWTSLRTLASLADDDFVLFVRDLELVFGLQLDDPLIRPDDEPIDRDVAHVAQTLQDIVRDPARPVELSRDELMERLGWSGVLQYRHPHRFPVPAAYTTNEAARIGLESRLSQLSGGYLALVGPAGSGKSTLLTSLNVHGHVARYYAFVPDAPDPLSSRGEADSFLHDLSLALEESGLTRRGVGNDLRAQRAVLQAQLDKAGRRWIDRGERTIIVVDGLDHIPREQHPTRSLIEELPAPTALPDGVFIILGTQTTSILPQTVQTALEHQDRIAPLPPLSAPEIKHLANAVGVGSWLYPGQMTTLVDASEGHPLALTYVLQELSALEASEPDIAARRERADRLLSDASEYGGDVASRYRGYFQAVSGDQQVLDLLGAVARLRVPVNLDWLSSWAEPHAVAAFTTRTATFFRRSGADWQFIHNSFRCFLADETARIAGRVDDARDRQFHQNLADVCAGSDDGWTWYRDEEVAHRFLAGQHDRVLELVTPDRLRQSLLDLRPSATVRDHALLALRSANLTNNAPAFVRMMVFLNELWLRGTVLEPEPFATAVRHFDPALALEHIVRGGRLRIKAGAALDHAAEFAKSGDIDAAQRIVQACGGLAGLTADRRAAPSAVADWAEVTWRLSGLDFVLAEIEHHLPHPAGSAGPSTNRDDQSERPNEPARPQEMPEELQQERHLREQRERDANIINCRNLAHARCFDLLVETRDDDALDALTAIIDAEAQPSWRARARYMRARAASSDRARADVLRWVREVVAIDANTTATEEDDDEVPARDANAGLVLNLRIAAAELLIRNGFTDTPEIDLLVPAGTAVNWPSTTSSGKGLEPFKTLIALSRLRHVHPDSTRPDVLAIAARSSQDVGDKRFQRALRALVELEGQQLAVDAGIGEPPVVAAHTEPIVRLLEVPARETQDWTGWYMVRETALDLFRRVVVLAAQAGGSRGLFRLLTRFQEAWTTPDRAPYWTPERQQAVITTAINAHPDVLPWALERLNELDTAIDTRSSGPDDRMSLWLAQARARATAGDMAAARQAVRSAVRASLGLGISDHDRQLAEWLDWLGIAVDGGELNSTDFTETVRTYASRIASASVVAEPQAEAATEKLIALVFPKDVSLACELAEWLCDAGALSEADTIQAVVLAACQHPDIPIMHSAAATAHLLYPIMREPSRDIAEVVDSRAAEDADVAELLRLAEKVWTVRETRPDVREPQPDQGGPGEARTEVADEAPPIETIGALLTALRKAPTAEDGPAEGWEQAVEHTSVTTVSPAMARALLEQARRLRLGGSAMGNLAALAARSGEADLAAETLAEALSRSTANGWLRHWDGGSRLTTFDAALRDRHPILTQLARHDLATSLTTGSLSGQLSPTDIRRIMDLVAGPDVIARAWPDIENYLNELTPVSNDVPTLQTGAEQASAVEAFTHWVAHYLRHPVRPLDFGARRTLQIISRDHADEAHRVLANAVLQGGWACEAALLTLITTPAAERAPKLSPELVSAVQAAATAPDGISRDLAGRLAFLYGVEIPQPAHRSLPPTYTLSLPPLPERTPPELDRHGTPHLDRHDPQQLVAPFDVPLRLLASMSDLKPNAVLHRAAAIAEASVERWTRGGHRAQADLLTARQQRLPYRPWAYMAGRRALGIVLSELFDADALGDLPMPPAYYIGLVGEKIARVEPQPIPTWMPLPWRPEGTKSYDVKGWCTEAPQAAHKYANAYISATPYILAEYAQWRSLEWSTPEEERCIYAFHRVPHATHLLVPEAEPWEDTYKGAHRYPLHLNLDWDHEELVIHGRESRTDAPHMEWLALHPTMGVQLGWQHDPQELFTWTGKDSQWRARTVVLMRGQPWHRPPAHVACAEVWQVQLSNEGLVELRAAFPTLTRSLEVTRRLHANPREGHPEDEIRTHQTAL